MESCDALTKKGYTCSHGAKYCIAYNGEVKNICSHHKRYLESDSDSKKSPDFFYDKKHNKLVVNRIARVPHDPLTNLPTRYTEGLTDKQKLKYLKEIEESRDYYKRTGKVKEREPVSRSLSPHRSSHAEEFERRYGFKVTDLDHVRHMFPDTDIDKILAKGQGAYMSGGSRPNTSSSAWKFGRLSAVLTCSPKAISVDKNLVGPKSLKIACGNKYIPK